MRRLADLGYDAVDSEDVGRSGKYPEFVRLHALKPWRFWTGDGGTRELAMEWEDAQRGVVENEVFEHEVFSCHANSFLTAKLVSGNLITVILSPIDKQIVTMQRQKWESGLKMIDLGRANFERRRPDLITKGQSLGRVVEVEPGTNLDSVVQLIQDLLIETEF